MVKVGLPTFPVGSHAIMIEQRGVRVWYHVLRESERLHLIITSYSPLVYMVLQQYRTSFSLFGLKVLEVSPSKRADTSYPFCRTLTFPSFL